jgi:competence protein ComGB
VFEQQNQFLFFQEEAKRLRGCLLEGDQLATILKNTSYYDKELATVILHGQANGILSSELMEYSNLIIDEFEETFTFWLRILQPAIMMFIGLFVVLLYVAIMLPIYGMIQTI